MRPYLHGAYMRGNRVYNYSVSSPISCNTISKFSFTHSFLSIYQIISLLYVCEESKALAKTVSCVVFLV